MRRLIILFSLIGIILIASVIFAKIYTPSPQFPVPDYPQPQFIINGSKIYNIRSGRFIDLLKGYSTPLWSPSGKLALLNQGDYDYIPKSFFSIPSAKATTAGFNYLLYLVDPIDSEPRLLLPEVFGQVRWAKDSTGFYYTKEYLRNSPLLLGNQSGMEPDRIDYFFVDLTGRSSPSTTENFKSLSYQPASDPKVSAEGFTATSGWTKNSPPKYFVEITDPQGNRFPLPDIGEFKPDLLYPAKWSPSGSSLAIIYKYASPTPPFREKFTLAVFSLDQILYQKFPSKFSREISADHLHFEWLNEDKLLVGQLTDLRDKYLTATGNIGIYDSKTFSFKPLTPAITSRIYHLELTISPDKQYFTYTIKPPGDSMYFETYVYDINGNQITILPGNGVIWKPLDNQTL